MTKALCKAEPIPDRPTEFCPSCFSRALLTLSLAFLLVGTSFGFRVTGRFLYENVEFSLLGATGRTSYKPIRYARVEVWNVEVPPGSFLGYTYTDENGDFTLEGLPLVTESDIEVRCYAESTPSLGFSTVVVDDQGNRAGISSLYVDQSPDQEIDFSLDPLIASANSGGQIFNIFDNVLDAFFLIEQLLGRTPDTRADPDLLVVYPGDGSYYIPGSNTLVIYGLDAPLDDDGYDDTVILHESGHFVEDNFTKTSNPGGPHFIDQDNEDLRLAWSEGWATFWCSMVRSLIQQSTEPEIYVDTIDQSVLGFSYELEGPSLAGGERVPSEWLTDEFAREHFTGSDFEVSVNAVLWDIFDGIATADRAPGVDDDPVDISNAETEIWEVLTSFVWKLSPDVNLETFWLGWFSPYINNGYRAEMEEMFNLHLIEFFADNYEASGDDSPGGATELVPGDQPQHHTFYRLGSEPRYDQDWFWFSATAGSTYIIETTNATNNGDTVLQLYDSSFNLLVPSIDPTTGLDPNNPAYDDKAILATDPAAQAFSDYANSFSSLITFVPQRSGIYYVLCTHYAGPEKYPYLLMGISGAFFTGIGYFGSYDIAITESGAPFTLRIDDVQPNGGPLSGGTVVTIEGSGFDTADPDNVRVYFGSTEAENVNVLSSSKISVTSPLSTVTTLVDVTVENPSGQTATFTDGFFYADSGDVDGSGTITLNDATIIGRIEAGLQPTRGPWPADVDGNGIVNILDAFIVVQAYRGKVSIR